MKNQLEKISILALSAVMFVAFQNCAPGEMTSKKKVDPLGLSSDGTTTVDTTPAGVVVDSTGADLKPASVNYSENIMPAMQNQLGVATPSTKNFGRLRRRQRTARGEGTIQ